MRRWVVIGAGALAALPLAAGCSTAVDGTAVPGTATPSLIPGHVYTVDPSTPPPTSTPAPHTGAITAACPLLPASDVGKALHASGLKAVSRDTGHARVYGCNYQNADGVLVSLTVAAQPKTQMTPEKSKREMAQARTACTDPKPISGLGPLSATCRLAEHPKITAGFTLQPAGPQVVLLSIDAPYSPGAAKTVSTLVRTTVSHLPGH
jgi:hypothetical protein